MTKWAIAYRGDAETAVPHLDLRILRQFLVVCESLSMSGAARSLNISPSAISQIVQGLENDLGVMLFERGPRGLRTTPAGILLRQRAKALLAAEAETLSDMKAYRGQLLPNLRLYILDNIGMCLMNTIVPMLSPLVRRLEVLSGRTLTHVRDFVRGDIDILISTEDFSDLPNLDRHCLCRQDLIAIAPAAIPPEKRDLFALAASLPLVRFREHSRMDDFVQAYLDGIGLDLPRTIECDSPGTMLELVAAGGAWTISTPLAVSWFRDRQNLLAWGLLPQPRISHDLFLVATSEKLLDIPELLARRCRAALETEVESWRGTGAEPGMMALNILPGE